MKKLGTFVLCFCMCLLPILMIVGGYLVVMIKMGTHWYPLIGLVGGLIMGIDATYGLYKLFSKIP